MKRVMWSRIVPLAEKLRDNDEGEFAGELKDPPKPCLVSTPQGVYDADDNPYDFWLGETNFDLTATLVNATSRLEGVELFNYLTRYRFRLGVGRAFDGRLVRRAVEEFLTNQSVFPPDIALYASALSSSSPFWAIYVFDGGKHEFVQGQTEAEVTEKGRKFEATASRVYTASGERRGIS